MKNYYFLYLIVLVFLLSSFKVDKACEYAGSNINYVKTQTEKAIAGVDINQARYFAYKALNAIEKSKDQLKECGCEYAAESISDGHTNLKLATRTTSLNGTRILLNRALENAIDALDALEEHELHKSQYANDVLALNTVVNYDKAGMEKPTKAANEKKIDASLESYRESLDKIINSVDCKEARAFAENIYSHCEQQLLQPNLSEGKKYYNLKTQEITTQALKKLGECK